MKHWIEATALFAALIVSTSSSFAQSASAPHVSSWPKAAQNECIASEATKALTTCPTGVAMKATKKSGVAFLEPDTQPANKTIDKPTSIPMPRGPQLSHKLETILMTEIVALEQQLAKTKINNPNHVTFARRLAESYYELEHIKQDEALGLTTRILEGEKKKENVVALRAQRTKAEALRDKSRARVIELYRLIVDQHGTYAKLDEVLYYLAYEYEQQKASDPHDKAQLKYERESKEKALATYLELIKTRPKSKFVAAAYVAYGDLYFEDALDGKIDWKIPLEAYDRVIQSGDPPDNKQWGYAQYKKGFIFWNLGQYKDAVAAFKKAIEFGTKFPELPKAPQIAEEARKELVPVYAEYGKADQAFAFFSALSGDRPGEKTKTIALLERLGDEYLGRAHPLEAKNLYTELKGHEPSNSCFYDTRIADAVISMNPKDKLAIRAQLSVLSTSFEKFRASTAPAAKKLACGNSTAWLMSEHAVAWEYEALGDLGCPIDAEKKAQNPKARPGTCNKATIQASLAVYKDIFKTFESFDGYKFNVKHPEDAPTILKLRYGYADLLYGERMWAEAAAAFDAVVALDPNSELASEASFGAVLSYQNLYDEQYKDKVRISSGAGALGDRTDDSLKTQNTPRVLGTFQSKMIGAFDRFVCFVHPDATSKTYKDDLERLVEIKYRRAFLYYEAKHWDEAAGAFREVATNHPDSTYGVTAATFYLDAVVRIRNYADPPRPRCNDSLGDEVHKLVELYCDKEKVAGRLGDKKRTDEFLSTTSSACDRFRAVKGDLDALRFASLAKSGKLEEAAEGFAKLADRCIEEHAACEKRADVYLYNAARAYQTASKVKKAMDLRQRIVATVAYRSRETYRLTMFDLAEDYRRIALYGRAADWYEKFAASEVAIGELLELAQSKIENERVDHPEKYKGKKLEDVAKEATEEQRASALANAVLLRLGLGQAEEAIKDSEIFAKKFGGKHATQTRQIFLAIGEHYVEQHEWKKGVDRLEKFIKGHPDARLDEKMHAHAMVGRAYREQKQLAMAEKYFGEIRADWAKNRDKLREEIEHLAKDNPSTSSIRTNAYGAVAEAYLFFADLEAEKARDVKFEPYKGNGDFDDTDKWFRTKFTSYLLVRLEKNKPAFVAYQRVLCLGDEVTETSKDKGCTREWKSIGEQAAAKFVVEAASKAGDLYADTYDKARSAPLSNELVVQPGDSEALRRRKLEIQQLYYSIFDRVAEPIKTPARSAFQECLLISTQARFFDAYSERCERWLAKVYKSEFRTLEELKPAAGLVGKGLDRAFLVDTKLIPFDPATRK